MNQQLSLFATLRGPAFICPIDPDGAVVRGEIDQTLILPHPKMAWHAARIELHRQTSTGNWMWSTSWCTNSGGRTYKVGEKWGKFAATRDDALYHAIAELREGIRSDPDTPRILNWLDGLEAAI